MKTFSLVLYHMVGLSFLFPLWKSGWIEKIWEGDSTKLSVIIGTFLLFGMGLSLFKKWRHVGMLREMLLFLGLIGTVLGVIVAFSGVEPGKLDDIDYVKEMGTVLLSGMGTALYTTLVGAIGFVWLTVCQHFWEK